MAEDKARCPFCNEEILASAIKCKHCHEWVGKAQGKDSGMARAVSRGIKQKNLSKISLKANLILLFGAFVLVVNVIGHVFRRIFGEPITSDKFEWLIPYILIPVILVAVIVAYRMLVQYYKE